jgi:hypothetical protein
MPRALLCLTGSSLDIGLAPHGRDFRIAVDAELHHEALDHAEEARIVEVAVLDEIVEAVGAVRRPVAMHLDHEAALAGIELGLVDGGRLFGQAGGV